jgi:hypothetical protein
MIWDTVSFVELGIVLRGTYLSSRHLRLREQEEQWRYNVKETKLYTRRVWGM